MTGCGSTTAAACGVAGCGGRWALAGALDAKQTTSAKIVTTAVKEMAELIGSLMRFRLVEDGTGHWQKATLSVKEKV
jgi:hypothetical protein